MNKVWTYIGVEKAKSYHLYGVKGWLLFFYIASMFGCLTELGGISNVLMGAEYTGWNLISLFPGIGINVFWILLCFVVISYLFASKHPKTRLIVISLLIATLFVKTYAFAQLGDIPGVGADLAIFVLGWIINVLIWIPYFIRSKRARLTFDNQIFVENSSLVDQHGYRLASWENEMDKNIEYPMLLPIKKSVSEHWFIYPAILFIVLTLLVLNINNNIPVSLSNNTYQQSNNTNAQKTVNVVKTQPVESLMFQNTINIPTFPQTEQPLIQSPTTNESPKFTSYPAQKTYYGKNVAVKLVSEFDHSFRTRLRATQNYQANFAGDYVLTAWGCGAMCLMGAAVNTQTGDVVSLPGSICCWQGDGENVIFKPNSRLLVLAGYINEEGEYGAHFYELKDKKFVHIKTNIVPKNSQF
ncbi:DUF2569 family protein [Advenella sp. WQ 585]|uniref:DUF2569 family protein n=1 Tax=Advenella mandrilli TaxID=2800330 RepID=A0ABS1EAD4_9BURK|nr:DUF2569 family protein [Advenella mandrilli]MBK1779708.1 DUF2569 family protein [Advenella mandrilli]